MSYTEVTDGFGVDLSSTASTTNDLHALGPFALALDQQTHPGDTDYQILPSDRYVSTDVALTSPWTWRLPAANSVSRGWQITVADAYGVCSLTYPITVPPAGADTINSVTSAKIVNSPFAYLKVRSDGVSNWTVVDQFPQTGTPVGVGNYQILTTDTYVYTTTAIAAIYNLALPAAATVAQGWRVVIADAAGVTTSVNYYQIATLGSDTLNGAAPSTYLQVAYAALEVMSDGASNWSVTSVTPNFGGFNGTFANLSGQFFGVGAGTQFVASGRNDNLTIAASFSRFTTNGGAPSAAWSISGIVAPTVVAYGATYYLLNKTSFALTLLHENTNSTAANRITSPTAADLVVPVGGVATLAYEGATSARWIIQNVYDGTLNPTSPMTTAGDIIYGGTSGAATRLAKGAANAVLQSGTTPAWTAQDGWIADTNTWTYASATTFTIAGVDATGYLPKGTKISYNDGSTDYGHVAAVSFSTNTTVTLITNSDYSIANATLSAPRYSYADSPQAFPTWFNWSPTLAGWSANPTNVIYRYRCDGTAIQIVIRQLTNGTSNNATHTATLPVAATTISNMLWLNPSLMVDNNVTQVGTVFVASAGTTVSLAGIAASSNNTNSGNSRAAGAELTYEI